ncbi:DUF423 domain-containing protein [Sphingomonas sp. ID1715]|uniref:DUF423 domain-containing protein n=1 Tax=Sphingomonas sp. ID1715 TaxID=1656898 RepID=UPI0014879C83|nr:DUF423 domain-containing protein [Sphingomonas sp. ID1715]NNM75521.1 DUF423 domain-containing protein [Sphingomonas sp. ID1715]
MPWLQKLAALSAAIAIAAGALGAHRFAGKEAEWLRTGGLYQLLHAVVVLALARQVAPAALWVLLGGATLFAATLYAMAFGAPRSLGAITPIGGALMIVGWLWLAWRLR